jgi:predicted kinase
MTGIIVTRGIPASGKSTWAVGWVAADPTARVRVNLDELRRMMFGRSYGLTHLMETTVVANQQRIVRDALSKGFDVVVDGTNLRAKHASSWFGFSPNVSFQDFPIAVEEAVARDGVREHPVGADVVRSFAKRFLTNGDFPAVPVRPTFVDAAADVTAYIPDVTLDTAVIFDIDGTLAHIIPGGRSPFDGTRVHEDTVDASVAHTLTTLKLLTNIVLMSGREESCRQGTEKWLRDNNIHFDALHMRATDDNRKDSIIKRELFDNHVAHRYNVTAVFDDRRQVVDMWRGIGLKCFQVQDGDF